MNSRERVLAAFAHEQPDQVPRWCGASDEFWAKAKAALGMGDEALRRRIGNDFGSQNGPLLGIDQFERFVLPHLERLIDLGNDYGLLVQFVQHERPFLRYRAGKSTGLRRCCAAMHVLSKARFHSRTPAHPVQSRRPQPRGR